ncbi:MAG: amidohydrolase [Pleurocapsa sp. SU_196_0]|nr:amidohydrolase [Pleurocapsa sp. SU_196_0]
MPCPCRAAPTRLRRATAWRLHRLILHSRAPSTLERGHGSSCTGVTGCTAEVEIVEGFPVTINDARAAAFAENVVTDQFGEASWIAMGHPVMGAEDFAFFVDPSFGIPGYYFAVGGTNPEWIKAAKEGGPPVAGHHSPLFKIDPEPSVRLGVEADERQRCWIC